MPLLASSLIAALTVLASLSVVSQPLVQTGRYTAVAAVPTEAQQDPLQAIVTVTFPGTVTTIAGADEYLLKGTGYGLAASQDPGADVSVMLNGLLPDVQRSLGPLTILGGLKTLAGAPFRVLIDPVHRLIGFELEPSASALGFGIAPQKEDSK